MLPRTIPVLVALLGLAVGLAGCGDQEPVVDQPPMTPEPAEPVRSLPESWYGWNAADGAPSLRLERDPDTYMDGGIEVPADFSRLAFYPAAQPTVGWSETQPALLVIWLFSYHPTSIDLYIDVDADGERVGEAMATVLLTTAGLDGTPVATPQKVEVPFDVAPVPAGARLSLTLYIDHTDALDRGRGGDWSTVLTVG